MVLKVNKLPQASFRDVPCLFQNSSIDNKGRKTATHEFPDSSIRVVEDLGEDNDIFTVNFEIDYNNNFSARDNFINALRQEGSGLLILPMEQPEEVTVVNFNRNDSKSALGITAFNITFQKSDKNRFPQIVEGNTGLVSSLKDEILQENTNAFVQLWSDVTDNKAKFDSAVAKVANTINDRAQGIRRVASNIRSTTDGFAALANSLNDIIQAVNVLVTAPSDLATSFQFALSNFETAYDNAQDTFDSIGQLLGFTAGDQDILQIGGTQADKLDNQNLMNSLISVNALAIGYNQAVNITYNNTDELNKSVSILENGFLALSRDAIPDDLYNSILELRKEVNNIFKNLTVGLPVVTLINYVNPRPLAVLVYELYGSLDLINDIEDLNSFRDTSNISGDVRILSGV